MLTKSDLKWLKENLVTKEDAKQFASKKYIGEAIKDATSQILGAVDRGFSETASNDDIEDHEKRISRLEKSVFSS